MARSISIAFQMRKGLEIEDVHRIRNFAEELSLTLKKTDLGSLPMQDADTAVDRLQISEIKTRRLKRAKALIHELLEAHLLERQAIVSDLS